MLEEKQIDKAVHLYQHGVIPSRIASRLRVDLEEVKRALNSRGMILKKPLPVDPSGRACELDPDRSANQRQHRR
jgi:hypothetical protein